MRNLSQAADDMIDEVILTSAQWGYVSHYDAGAIVELEAKRFLTIDPTARIFRLTAYGVECCHRFTYLREPPEACLQERTITWMSKRAYARYRGICEKAVRKACAGRIAFAMNDEGKIDRDLADALWVATPNSRVTRLPPERRPKEWVWPEVDHDRAFYID